jgi:hypothetical protein
LLCAHCWNAAATATVRGQTQREKERERENRGRGPSPERHPQSYAPRFCPSSLRTSFFTPQFLSAPRFHPSSLTAVLFRTSNSLRPSFATLHYVLRTSVSSFLSHLNFFPPLLATLRQSGPQ